MTRPERAGPTQSGLLVVTVVTRAAPDELLFRVLCDADPFSGDQGERFVSVHADETLDYVAAWLARFGDAAVTPPRRRPVNVVDLKPLSEPGEGD